MTMRLLFLIVALFPAFLQAAPIDIEDIQGLPAPPQKAQHPKAKPQLISLCVSRDHDGHIVAVRAMWFDAESGLYNTLYRQYDPYTGRWLQRDPVYFGEASRNLYGSMNGQWGTMADPLGLETAFSRWLRENAPPILGVPLAGISDLATGTVQAVGGIATSPFDKGKNLKAGLKEAGEGVLSTVGLKEALTEKWEKPSGRGGTGTLPLPESLIPDIKKANASTPKEHADDAARGMHSWHAGSNAALTSRLGPFMTLFILLGGILHEVADKPQISAEVKAQGGRNATLDAIGDITANFLGSLTGLFVPAKHAPKAGRAIGSIVPGPPDPNPTGAGTQSGKGP